MDTLDHKIRRFLVDEGYLFPITDAEIERTLLELKDSPITVPEELDNPLFFIGNVGLCEKQKQ